MTVRILTGDAREVLRSLPDESVHCLVSSPPYWRQRDYRVAGQLGLELRPEQYIADLVGIFSEARRILRDDGTAWVNIGDKWASLVADRLKRNCIGIELNPEYAAMAERRICGDAGMFAHVAAE